MRLKAKYIGDDVSLDEYNAYQYLLYHMTGWNETVQLDMETPHKGKLASYKLNQNTLLLNERNNTYKIADNLPANTTLNLTISDVADFFNTNYVKITCTLYYKDGIVDNDTEFQASDAPEVELEGTNVAHTQPDPVKEFKNVTVDCSINKDVMTIPLFKEGKALLKKNSLLFREIKLNLNFNVIPWIDLSNGKANEPYEILVDDVDKLSHIIENAPNDGTSTIIRLDSTKEYFVPETLIISKGQNIEIRGGTGEHIKNRTPIMGEAVIDGKFCKRTFIVKPGAELKLDHLCLQNNNSYGLGVYDVGRGGAILVEAIRREDGVNRYGVLRCSNCTFKNNVANMGGAIFSYHAGCFIDKCVFLDNNSKSSGGAVYYSANNVRLHFANMVVENKSLITLSVKVTDYMARPVGEGEIEFRLKDGTDDILLETVDVTESWTRRGWATYQYKIPDDNKKTTLHFLAIYYSGALYEREVAMNTVNIIVPQTYTASFLTKLVGIPNEISTISVKVMNPDGGVVKKPVGTFTIGDKQFPAQHDGNAYFVKYKIPEDIKVDEIKISFEIEDSIYYNCKKISDVLQIGSDKKTPIDGDVTGLFVEPKNIVTTAPNSKTYTDSSIDNDIVQAWVSAGITDLFVRCVDYTDAKKKALLDTVLAKVSGKKIRVHAVLNAFYDEDGSTQTAKWGTPNPSALTQRQNIVKQITALLKYTPIDGICFDYCRFQGGTDKAVNGNVEEKNRKGHVTEAIKLFVQEIERINKKIYTSVCLMPEDTDAYGQDYTALSGVVDYLIPQCYKGNYAAVSNDSDNWIVGILQTMMITNMKVSKDKIFCCIQTYTNDTELEKKIKDGKMKEALRPKSSLDSTIKVIAQQKVKGVCLYCEGYLALYPMTYKQARSYVG